MISVNNQQRTLLFHAVSLLLSLTTVLISSTLFVVIVYINHTIPFALLCLFIAIFATNAAIMAISLRGVMKTLPAYMANEGARRVVVFSRSEPRSESDGVPQEKYLSRNENEIVGLLRRNGSRMLQSSLTSSLPISKATISRTLTSLENKGALIRVRRGITNEVILSGSNRKETIMKHISGRL